MSSPAGAASGAQGGDAAQQGEGQGQQQQEQGDAQQGQQFDVGALAGQFEQLQSSQEEIRQYLQTQAQQQQQQQQEAAPPEEPVIDTGALEEMGYDEQQAQIVADAFQQYAAQAVQQAVNPVQERVAEMEREIKARDLAAEFPDLEQPENAKRVLEATGDLVAAHGWPQQMVNDPGLWRLVWTNLLAGEAASLEGRESPESAHLEGGAGASPAAAPQVDLAKQIADASTGGGAVLPFQ